ncbi:MAG: hypothetical protein Q6K80_10980 [Thermostichus sp. DG_1_6_bins_120]
MTEKRGVGKAAGWALGICFWLYGLGSASVQAQVSPRPILNGSYFLEQPGQTNSSPYPASEPEPGQTPPPLPGRLPRLTTPSLTTPTARPQTPAPERWRPVLPSSEAEGFPFSRFPLLKKLDPPSPSLADLGIDLERLALLPDPELAEEMDNEFSRQLARLNGQIADKQERLLRLLQDWGASETEIRQMQIQLSALRTERDRLALEHLLLLRQLQENFALPLPSRSAAGSP